MSQRTPLAKVQGLGSAKEGTQQFLQQRLTAVANLVLVCFAIWLLATLAGADYAAVREHPVLATLCDRSAAARALRGGPHAHRYADDH